MNQATSFIDASQLYGHTVNISASIRTFSGGRLKTDIINGYEFCPQKQRYGSLLCDERDDVGVCFEAGNVLQSINGCYCYYLDIILSLELSNDESRRIYFSRNY